MSETQIGRNGGGVLRWVAGAALLVSVGAGCEERSEQARTLAETRRSLEAAAVSAQIADVPETQRRVYRDAMTALRPIASDTQGQFAPSAMRLLAGAQAGMAALAAKDVSEGGALVLDRVAAARRSLEAYHERHALAEAMSAPEPTKEIASLREEISERREELVGLEEGRSSLAEQVAALEGRASEREAEARRLREEAGVARSQALSMPPAERAEQIASAVAIEDEANQAESAAQRLQARVARVRPELDEVESQIARAERQIELLRLAIGEMESLDQAGEARAEMDRELAGDEAAAFDAGVDAIQAAIAERFDPALEEALGSYQDASSMAMRAANTSSLNETKTSERLAAGRYLQGVASLRGAERAVLEPAALLLRRASEVRPSLPEAERYADLASALRSRIDSAEQAERAAYAEARDAFASARVRGEAGEQVQRLVDRLNERAQAPGGEPSDGGGQSGTGQPERPSP